jgi:ABC-type methionine transport system permease subunit
VSGSIDQEPGQRVGMLGIVGVWSLVALGVTSGVASAVMLVVAHLIFMAPDKKLLELDIDRVDAAAVLVYRSIPFLLLSVLILASTSIVVAAKKA